MSLTRQQAAAVEYRIQELAEASGEPEHDWPWYYEGLRAEALREFGLTEEETMEQPLPDQIVQALMHGDLSGLNDEQKLQLYQQTCASLGLNPLTNPLRYLELKEGKKTKLVLYTGKGCADQLRSNRAVSTEILSRTLEDGLCVVVARSKDASGRYVDDIGIVPLFKLVGAVWKTNEVGDRYMASEGTPAPLQGEALANAIMKAITKAKNRSTLSFCGLGMLDESEIDSITGAVDLPTPAAERPALPPSSAVGMGTKTTITPAPEKVPAPPFAGTSSTPTASATAPAPAGQSASASAPPPSGNATSTGSPETTSGNSPELKPIDKLNPHESFRRLERELRRICGSGQDATTKQHRVDVLTHLFGPEIVTMAQASKLGKTALHVGLHKAAAMTGERPPASTEEDVPLHLPPLERPQEGPHVPPGETPDTNGSIPTQASAVVSPDATGEAEEPSDNPLMNADNFVDPGEVRVLALYAAMNGQEEVWFTMCEGRDTHEGTPVLSLPAYRAIKNMIKRGMRVNA